MRAAPAPKWAGSRQDVTGVGQGCLSPTSMELTVGSEGTQQADSQTAASTHVLHSRGHVQLHQGGEASQHGQRHGQRLCVEEEQCFFQNTLQAIHTVRKPSLPNPIPAPQAHPHLSQDPQLPGVPALHGRKPAAVALLQESFSTERSSCIATGAARILQHKGVLRAEAQEAAQHPARQSRAPLSWGQAQRRGSAELSAAPAPGTQHPAPFPTH